MPILGAADPHGNIRLNTAITSRDTPLFIAVPIVDTSSQPAKPNWLSRELNSVVSRIPPRKPCVSTLIVLYSHRCMGRS